MIFVSNINDLVIIWKHCVVVSIWSYHKVVLGLEEVYEILIWCPFLIYICLYGERIRNIPRMPPICKVCLVHKDSYPLRWSSCQVYYVFIFQEDYIWIKGWWEGRWQSNICILRKIKATSKVVYSNIYWRKGKNIDRFV